MPLVSGSKTIALAAAAIAAGLGLGACSGAGGVSGVLGHKMTLDEAKADTLQFAREQLGTDPPAPNTEVLIAASGGCNAERVAGITDKNTATEAQLFEASGASSQIGPYVVDQLTEEEFTRYMHRYQTPEAEQVGNEYMANDWTSCQLLEKLKAVS